MRLVSNQCGASADLSSWAKIAADAFEANPNVLERVTTKCASIPGTLTRSEPLVGRDLVWARIAA